MINFFNILQLIDQLDMQLYRWYSWHAIFNHINIYDFNSFVELYTYFNIYENWFAVDSMLTVQSFLYDTCAFDIFNYSVPNIKLYYPEPFIATPSYIHDDFWFIHITIYQYWLWFFFISLIVFFFLSFLIAIRWNTIRFRPGRETRGVSRSKCGDLITATVPVSWASSIIIHESTDAIEFYDGFGSTEMAVGIRAYQWGWEYYYPRNTDLLNWNDTKTLYIGKSIKYPLNNWNDINQNIFKNYSYLANLNQSNTLSLYLWSNWNTTNTQTLANTTFSCNKLINNSTTLLITTPRLLSMTSHFTNINNNLFINSYWLYKKFLFTSIHTSQTSVIWNQFLLSNSYMLYNILLDSLISKNINLFLNINKNIESEWLIWYKIINYSSTLDLLKKYSLTSKYNLNQSELLICSDSLKKLNYELNFWNELTAVSFSLFNFYAEQDFKQWSVIELFEDLVWDFFINHRFYYKYVDKNLNLINIDYSNLNYSNPNIIHEENSFFRDFSLVELPYDLVYQFNSIWSYTNYIKFDLLNLNSLYWLNDNIIGSFFKLKWNQYLIWILQNNSYFYFTLNYKHITIYEMLYNYFSLSFNYWLSTQAESHLNGNMKSLIWNLSSNWVTSSKLFNTNNNSFWKIFKSSFQDERTLFNFKIFSNSYLTMPYNNNQLLLLNTIQKNSLIFYAPIEFRNYLYQNNTYMYNLDIIWKNFTFTFPFLTSTDSDIMRYIWFDWYTTRSSIVTKSIDTSLYNLHGTLNYNYTFTKQPLVSLINKTDNFFIKYMHARKLYIPFSIYSPYYFNKIFKNNFFNDCILDLTYNFKFFLIQLNILNLSLWLDCSLFNMNNILYFNNNLSFIMTNSHGFNLITTLTNMVDYLTQLNDILVKRNYLLLYLNMQLNVFYLPLSYQVTLWNPLIQLFKHTNIIINSTDLHYYQHLNQTLPLVLTSYLNNYKSLNLYLNNQVEIDTLKNPYQPLRKGVTNMIRVHADKAVAMPIDTRLQILAVSRDIIHSWAIPSAGIKIDCIPGYSSHRITFFLLSGIYWGQCMEICGRFHHWMPIVVYFIRRDLFCIWCIHFIFTNKQLNMVNQTFEVHNNYLTSNIGLSTNYWLYEM